MKTVEVRCCCNPTKLLGYLDIPKDLPLGSPRTFAGLSGGGHITFEYGMYSGGGLRGYALKNKDHPIEVLRQIPGFREVRS